MNTKPKELTVGSLFSGIGGLDLGLERAGMRVVWQCEADPYCRAVLRHHWPDIQCFEDIRELCTQGGWWVKPPDLLCGGFPCQPVSSAGKKLAQEDPRWLWPEFARVVGRIRPEYVLVENVTGLRTRGLSIVISDLAEMGYDAEWEVVSAAACGAPHLRERFFIVGRTNPQSSERGTSQLQGVGASPGRASEPGKLGGEVADANREAGGSPWPAGEAVFRSEAFQRLGRCGSGISRESEQVLPDPHSSSLESWGLGRRAAQASGAWWWATEPDVGRVAHGVPNRLAQLRALGNAVVPQVAEAVGRMILASL